MQPAAHHKPQDIISPRPNSNTRPRHTVSEATQSGNEECCIRSYTTAAAMTAESQGKPTAWLCNMSAAWMVLPRKPPAAVAAGTFQKFRMVGFDKAYPPEARPKAPSRPQASLRELRGHRRAPIPKAALQSFVQLSRSYAAFCTIRNVWTLALCSESRG